MDVDVYVVMGPNQYEKSSNEVSTSRFFLGVIRGFFWNITLIITIYVFWEYTKKNMQQEKEREREKIDVE